MSLCASAQYLTWRIIRGIANIVLERRRERTTDVITDSPYKVSLATCSSQTFICPVQMTAMVLWSNYQPQSGKVLSPLSILSRVQIAVTRGFDDRASHPSHLSHPEPISR